jgi:hypothetical protein
MPPQTLWGSQGPAPQNDPNKLLINSTLPSGPVSGRVSALAIGQDSHGNPALFLGAASGGVWRTTDTIAGTSPPEFADAPSWTQVSDNLVTSATNPTPLGPLGVIPGANNIGGLAADPTVPAAMGGIVYAGTGEANYSPSGGAGCGILKSVNGGDSWFLLAQGSRTPAAPLAFVGHSFSKILVAAVPHTVPGSSPPVVDPAGVTLYAALVPARTNSPTATDGIYKSTDGGEHWDKLQVIRPGAADPPLLVTDLEFTLINGQLTLYAGLANRRSFRDPNAGIWKSTDGGRTWRPLPGAPAGATLGRISLAADHRPSRAPRVYAAIGKPVALPDAPDTLLKVVRTDDNGNTWQPVIDPTRIDNPRLAFRDSGLVTDLRNQSGYNLSLGVVPNDPNTVYLGLVRTVRLTGGGAGSALLDGVPQGRATGPSTFSHPDHHAWAFTGNVAYDGNDGGIWKFKLGPGIPPALIWVNMNTEPLSTLQVNAVATNNLATPNVVILIGSHDNGTARTTTGERTSWNTVAGGDGGLARIDGSSSVGYRMQPPPDSGENIIWQSPAPSIRGPARSSLGDFGTWDVVTQLAANFAERIGGGHFPFYAVFAISPVNGRHLVLGSYVVYEGQPNAAHPRQPLWRNTNGPDNPEDNPVTALTFAAGSDLIVYAGTKNGTLYRTFDIGAASVAWNRIDNLLMTPWGGRLAAAWPRQPITSLYSILVAAFPYVLVTFGGNAADQKLFIVFRDIPPAPEFPRIRPQGLNLTGTGLPNVAANSVWSDSRSPSVLYLAMDTGVYSSPGPGPARGGRVPQRSWTRFGPAPTQVGYLPVVKVTDLQPYTPLTDLLAATFGRSVYSIPLPALPAARGVEGQGMNNVPLGNFADTSGPGTYSVSIDWGDGTPLDTTTGAVDASGNVTGSHTYADEGLYSATASVTRSGGATITLPSVTIAIADAPLAISALTVSGGVSSPVPAPATLAATFTDANTASTTADFTGLADWGDGNVTPVTITGGSGTFTVSASYTYANAGSFLVTLTILDVGEATVSGTARPPSPAR